MSRVYFLAGALIKSISYFQTLGKSRCPTMILSYTQQYRNHSLRVKVVDHSISFRTYLYLVQFKHMWSIIYIPQLSLSSI
jgi:hypothetical protein